MRRILLAVFVSVAPAILLSQNAVRIHGRVSDFNDTPIDGAHVRLVNEAFQPVAESVSDDSGYYELLAPPGHYMALLAIREDDYRSSRLEYWAWDVPALGDLEINPRYDRMEIYAMNAFRPQGGYPSYFVYFRPMSLSMLTSGLERDSTFLTRPHIDIAPDFTPEDLEVQINNEQVAILTMTRVEESGGASVMYGYLIQCELPKERTSRAFDMIRITAVDPGSKDKGEGLIFVENSR